MKQIKIDDLENWYASNYQKKLSGRWLVKGQIIPLIKNLNSIFSINKVGTSYLKNDIYSIGMGNGKTKILIWTQMHGNESSGTKALFDLFRFFENSKDLINVKNEILNKCTLLCIPMLNPDGAQVYTRVNAQEIDLNRDVIDKKAKESNILQDVLKDFQPDYCFNMHDQRSMFSVGKNNNPATISFLAPSVDKERTLTDGRKETMKVIVSMYNLLKKCIPNQLGRYTDEFYPTATGDNFQKMGYNTVLIESGHYFNDYQREVTRKYTFYALLQGILYISGQDEIQDYKPYFDIPDNEKKYLDIILKNIRVQGINSDIGILFEEKLVNNQLLFVPKVNKIENLSAYNANKIIDNINLVFHDENDINDWLKNQEF